LALAGAVLGTGALAVWWSQRSPRGGAPPKASVRVAVLPFKPLGGEARDELLEIGMADSLAARLSALPGLAVLSTGSVLRYAGGAQDPLPSASFAARSSATPTSSPRTSTAMVQAALGDKAAALDSLEQAYRWRDVRLIYLNSDPSWRGLRGEPRFDALLKRLKLYGLPAGLTPV
jgi:hypothetical protein